MLSLRAKKPISTVPIKTDHSVRKTCSLNICFKLLFCHRNKSLMQFFIFFYTFLSWFCCIFLFIFIYFNWIVYKDTFHHFVNFIITFSYLLFYFLHYLIFLFKNFLAIFQEFYRISFYIVFAFCLLFCQRKL